MSMDSELLEAIDQKLSHLLRLKVEEKFEEDATNKEKIRILYKFGFSTSEMADIIGTSNASVRGTLSSLRQEGAIDD